MLLRCGVGGRAAQLVWFGISGGAADGETETTTTGSVSFSQGGMHYIAICKEKDVPVRAR